MELNIFDSTKTIILSDFVAIAVKQFYVFFSLAKPTTDLDVQSCSYSTVMECKLITGLYADN